MDYRSIPPGSPMRPRKLIKGITRGVIPPLVILLILSCSFLSVFATQPNLPSNVTKLGVPVNQAQNDSTAYFWSFHSTCSCGAPLYFFSHLFPLNSIPDHSYIFISLNQYSESAYRYSVCGEVYGDVNEVFYGSSHSSNDNTYNYKFAVHYAFDVNTGVEGEQIVVHGDKADWVKPTMYSIVDPSLDAYDDISTAFTRYVKNGPHGRFDLASVSVAYFAVPIYQEALDDYYIAQNREAYNDGQINAFNNRDAFELIPMVMDEVTTVVLRTFNSIELYGISLNYLVFIIVCYSVVAIFMRLRF